MSDSENSDQTTVTKKPSLEQKDTIVASKKNDLVGVLILSAGVALLLAVGAFIYMDRADAPPEQVSEVAEFDNQKQNDGQENEGSDNDDCPGCEVPYPEMAALPNASKMVAPSVTDLSGRWTTSFKGSIAELVLAGQQFQIIYLSDPQSGFRKYARGYFSYNKNDSRITLMPAPKLGPPKDVPGITYQVLTLRYFDVVIKIDKEDGKTLYWMAPEEMLKSQRIHPLLLYTGNMDMPYLRWDKL